MSESQEPQVPPFGRFFIGLAMLIGGVYLFLDNIQLIQFGLSYRFFSYGGYHLTTGLVFIPFIFGIVLVFYDSRLDIGWWLCILSLLLIVYGVLRSIQFRFIPMSAFELSLILVLGFGGLGLILNAVFRYRVHETKDQE